MRNLFVLRGVAGCGKSTWIRNNCLEQYTISSDNVRLLYGCPEMDINGKLCISQKNNKKVWNFIYELLERRMKNGELVFMDATHTKPSSLSIYKKLCEKYKYKMSVIDFTDIPLEVIKYRNMEREQYKQVSDEVIERQYNACKTPIGKDIEVLNSRKIGIDYFKTRTLADYSSVMDEYKKIVVIGDIHSCYTPLKEYFDKNPMVDENAYVFLGDWFDRGIEAKETLEFLLSIYNKENVYLLKGNHELWIDNYVNDGEDAVLTDAFKKSLSDFGDLKNDLAKVRDKFIDGQIFYYNNCLLVMTHGGLPCALSFSTPAIQCIKGVGEYSDSYYVDDVFNNQELYDYSFHGHRNINDRPIQTGKVFNLEGKVEFGGYLRIVEIQKDGYDLHFDLIEIKNDVFDNKLKRKEFDENENIIKDLESSSLVHKKDLGDGTSSYNFTREAFWSAKWDKLTTTARGLFIDNETNEVVARSYPKFFAIDERPETEMRNLEKTLKFPVSLYRKENGYLGILSIRNGEFYICSKSTNKGDYAGWFKELLYKSVKKLDELKKYLLQNNVSMIFEVIDVEHDPHIIEYLESKIVLLDIVKNDFSDTFLPYNKLCEVADRFEIENKHWFMNVYNIKELNDTINGINELNLNTEGFVGVDENGFMFKYKTPYYKFWKYIRGLRDKILMGKKLPELDANAFKVVQFMEDLHNKGLLENMSIPEIRWEFNKNNSIDIKNKL